eukprot:TRINITY_DN11420_c0_g1::TRINITY_DN11420_c0_g1_i1::g.26388::m.26388 TRINITY_DN11420_c0_g1::TRINITY_DN11420_c0_g1_i1::g.26388  ORF type:complete len:245 (-),score=104.29,sp/B7IN18/PHNX_BACC2/32.24/3e-20,HAD_2/PF13419.1/6.6e-19,Hydrolase/PF00702.21/2.7e-08,Hydrolase_like/PF13242.1/9.2e-07,HAD/PF12710.2/0.0013 TRINITY_DN11420_c0_g1_i1:10-744(-)
MAKHTTDHDDTTSPKRQKTEPSLSLKERGIKLVVFDMAGTVVDEGGLVYDILKAAIREANIPLDEDEFNHWHGANKIEVVRHFTKKADKESETDAIFANFLKGIDEAYFKEDSTIKLVEGVPELFAKLQHAGIKVALDTGYAKNIRMALQKKLGLDDKIDGGCSADEVGQGRPYPYMIYKLVKDLNIVDIRSVAKVGDTVRDIEEGLNAGCGLVMGVLSGADTEETLQKAGAHAVLKSVADITI